MTPCALISYLDSNFNLRALPKCFKEEGYPDVGLLLAWLDQLKLNGLSINLLKEKYQIGNETSYTLKFIR